jgi:uncharacterized RDD family membrane protein YckC
MLAGTPALADDVLAHGTGEMFWVARVTAVQAPPGQGAGVATVIRGRAVGGADPRWTDVARLGSAATSLAHRGRELAVLLDSGGWLLVWPGGSTTGALPRDGTRLMAIASNNESIWAIARPDAGAKPAATAAATAPATSAAAAAASAGLYRLQRGQWVRVAALPENLTPEEIARASFAVVAAEPTISVLRPGSTIESFALVNERWEPLASIRAPDATRLKLMADGTRPVVWTAPDGGAGRLHVAVHGADGARGWAEPRALRTQEEVRPGAARTVALAGENVRLLFMRDDKLFEQTFAIDGAAITPAKLLPTSFAPPSPAPSRFVLVAAALLMIVVIGSLRRGAAGAPGGQSGAQTPAAIAAAAGVVPAPLLLRFLAGVVDASPLLVTCYVIFKDINPEAQGAEQVEMLARLSLPFYLALAAYLLHTWVFEALFARSIGKMIFGLRVVSLDGTRPTGGAIFARNALRLVDVMMLAVPLLFVILSPLSQRVGDIAARTIVAGKSSSREQPNDEAAKGEQKRTDSGGQGE